MHHDSPSSTVKLPPRPTFLPHSLGPAPGVLYNLGAMVSASAAATERTSDEGLKLACKQFQEAAGIFAHIHEKVRTGVVVDNSTSGNAWRVAAAH